MRRSRITERLLRLLLATSAESPSAIGGTGRTHTVVSYSNTASTQGVDAAFQNKSERSNAPQDYFGTANVQFSRELTIRDYALRQELAWVRGAHVVETGGELHHLQTGLRLAITGDRNTNEANGSSIRGGAGLPDLLDSVRTSTRGGGAATDSSDGPASSTFRTRIPSA